MSAAVDPFLLGAAAPSAPALAPNLAVQNQTIVSSDNVRMGELFSVPPSVGDYAVTPQSAMRISAVYSCVRLLAGIISTLPVHIYNVDKASGERQRDRNHPLNALLNHRSSSGYSSAAMFEWMIGCILLRGDGHAFIKRKSRRSGEIEQIIPLHPDRCVAELRGGELWYWVQLKSGDKPLPVHRDEMLHFPGFGFDGLNSMSPIMFGARNAISIAGSAETNAANLFSSDSTSRHVFKTPDALKADQRDELRDRFTKLSSEGGRALPLVLTGGMSVEAISLSAMDAQLLETRKFQVEDIARVYGVPPFMIGATEKSSSWGKGLEEMFRAFLITTLQPHLQRMAQELTYKLLDYEAGVECDFVNAALAKADLATRNKAYREALGGNNGPGWMTVAEVRRLENLPYIPGTDQLFTGPAATEESDEPEPESESDEQGEGLESEEPAE